MRHTIPIQRSPAARAFSLIEAVICILVIGVLTAISLTVLNPASKKRIESVSYRRTAQEFCSVANAALVAGARFVVPNDVPATMKKLVTGVSPTSGSFKGHVFKMPNVDDITLAQAQAFIVLQNGQLTYLANEPYSD